jgi:hypothetical protein
MDWIQWPAMAITVLASWLIASESERRRRAAFWLFIVSNGLWVAWGVPAAAYAVVALQVALFALNVRGAIKTHRAARAEASPAATASQ